MTVYFKMHDKALHSSSVQYMHTGSTYNVYSASNKYREKYPRHALFHVGSTKATLAEESDLHATILQSVWVCICATHQISVCMLHRCDFCCSISGAIHLTGSILFMLSPWSLLPDSLKSDSLATRYWETRQWTTNWWIAHCNTLNTRWEQLTKNVPCCYIPMDNACVWQVE